MIDDFEYSSDEEELIDSELIDRAREDILAFALLVKDDYEVNWHHKAIARKLNAFIRGEIRYLMVFMPPRHGKSQMVSRFLPAFIHGKFPDDEIMAASYLDSLAGDITLDVQRVMDSKIYKQIFPGVELFPPGTRYALGARNSSEHHIVGKRGKYLGQGVGGSFTGKGANWCIIDDPIKGREIADSEAYRERLWSFYNNDLFSRLETNLKTGKKGQVLITLTRWHEDDLAGRLIEKAKKDPNAVQWDILIYPAIKTDNDDPTDPREIGGALWPQKYDLQQLNQIKASVGPRAWGSLYQQNPMPDGAGLFKESMFTYLDLPSKFDYTFITADTAYKDKQENDFTVFVSFGVIVDELYVRDVWREQIKASDVEVPVERFIRAQLGYGYRGTYIEPKGHGIYLNQKFARKGLMIPEEKTLEEFYSDRRFDKMQRANNIVPHLAYRTVFVNKNIPLKEELVSECLKFPKTAHDDFVDCLIDAIKFVYSSQIGILDVL